MKKVAVLLSIASLALLASCGKKVETPVNTGSVNTGSEVKVEVNTGSDVVVDVNSGSEVKVEPELSTGAVENEEVVSTGSTL